MRSAGWAMATLALLAAAAAGCGATCDRIEEDRERFLGRKPKADGAHVEVLVPFAVAERLIAPQLQAVEPIAAKIPGLGDLAGYFGELTVAPRKVALRPAADGAIGFRLEFDVRSDGKRAFAMFVETEVAPQVDLAAGKVILGFTPEALAQARPGVAEGSKKELGKLVYERIPKVARMLLSRAAVEAAAGGAIDALLAGFYAMGKERLLPLLAERSRVELDLPEVPLAGVAISSTAEGGGRLRLALTTSLPVRAGVAAPKPEAPAPSPERVTVRMSGSALAELVNWAMGEGLLPDRYDDKGKAKPDGELRPGLDWARGEERPMRIHLWDLQKPCMRITMAAKPKVAVEGGQLEIAATDAKTTDVEASAFTKVGVWFYLLWKDAMKLHRKTSSKLRLAVAGQPIEATVASAAVADDELVLEVGVEVGKEE